MLLDIVKLSSIHKISPNGILHIGAHKGEEGNIYALQNWKPIYWVEAQTQLANALRLSLKGSLDKVFNAAIWDENGVQINLNITNNGESTSLLHLGSHKNNYRSIEVVKTESIETVRLDKLLENEKVFNFINLDVQGVELRALKSLGTRIAEVMYIYTEVNKEDVYEGCDRIQDIDRFLRGLGFERVATRWVLGKGWGDALYIKNAFRKSRVENIFDTLRDINGWYLPQIMPLAIEKLKRALPQRVILYLKKRKLQRNPQNLQ